MNIDANISLDAGYSLQQQKPVQSLDQCPFILPLIVSCCPTVRLLILL